MNEQKKHRAAQKRSWPPERCSMRKAATFYLYPHHITWLKQFNQSEKLRSLIDQAMQKELRHCKIGGSDLIEEINSLRFDKEQPAVVSDSQDWQVYFFSDL